MKIQKLLSMIYLKIKFRKCLQNQSSQSLSASTNTLLSTKIHIYTSTHTLAFACAPTQLFIVFHEIQDNPVTPTGDAAHHIDGRTYRKNPFVLFEQKQQRRAVVPAVRPHRRGLPLWPGSEKWSQAESLCPQPQMDKTTLALIPLWLYSAQTRAHGV